QDIVAQESAQRFDKLAESSAQTAANLDKLIQLQILQAQGNQPVNPAPPAVQEVPNQPAEPIGGLDKIINDSHRYFQGIDMTGRRSKTEAEENNNEFYSGLIVLTVVDKELQFG